MFGNMMDKLKEAQKQMEESKKRLDNIYVDSETENGKIKITATGNKKIKNISIDQSILDEFDKDAIEELLTIAINRALEQADKVHEAEMASMAKGMMPGLGF